MSFLLLEMIDLSSTRFLNSSSFWIYGHVFRLFDPINKLKKVFRVFLDVLGHKLVEKINFMKKIPPPLLFSDSLFIGFWRHK